MNTEYSPGYLQSGENNRSVNFYGECGGFVFEAPFLESFPRELFMHNNQPASDSLRDDREFASAFCQCPDDEESGFERDLNSRIAIFHLESADRIARFRLDLLCSTDDGIIV